MRGWSSVWGRPAADQEIARSMFRRLNRMCESAKLIIIIMKCSVGSADRETVVVKMVVSLPHPPLVEFVQIKFWENKYLDYICGLMVSRYTVMSTEIWVKVQDYFRAGVYRPWQSHVVSSHAMYVGLPWKGFLIITQHLPSLTWCPFIIVDFGRDFNVFSSTVRQ